MCPPTPGDWSPDALPVGVVDAPYSATITAENWNAQVDAFIDGELPEGLGYQGTASGITLMGVPAEAGTFPIAVATFTGDGGTCWPPHSYELVIEPVEDTSTGSTGTDESTGESG